MNGWLSRFDPGKIQLRDSHGLLWVSSAFLITFLSHGYEILLERGHVVPSVILFLIDGTLVELRDLNGCSSVFRKPWWGIHHAVISWIVRIDWSWLLVLLLRGCDGNFGFFCCYLKLWEIKLRHDSWSWESGTLAIFLVIWPFRAPLVALMSRILCFDGRAWARLPANCFIELLNDSLILLVTFLELPILRANGINCLFLLRLLEFVSIYLLTQGLG